VSQYPGGQPPSGGPYYGQPPHDPYAPPPAPQDPYFGQPPTDPYAPPQYPQDPYYGQPPGYPPAQGYPPPGYPPAQGWPPSYPPPGYWQSPPTATRDERRSGSGAAIVGLFLVLLGLWFLFREEIGLDFGRVWPVAAVALGALMVVAAFIPRRRA
jgi:hypothetical protein